VSETFLVADALARAAKVINTRRPLAAILDDLVRAAQDTIPGANHVGLSLTHRDGRVETLAATDDLVRRLDEKQYELAEGPCLDAIWNERLVVVNDVANDPRWPRYTPHAVKEGVRSQLGLQIFVEDRTVGGLNLYALEKDEITADVRQLAEIFAAQASLAMGKAILEDDLNAALGTRKVIGQAIGILMARYELDEDIAFQYLTRVSQTHNVKLREVAARLVAEANEAGRRKRARDG